MLASAAQAATFVYVSNAEDGNIGMYTLPTDGTLQPGPRVDAGKPVMPMSVSPDKRFLYAAVRSRPFTVVTYSIDRQTGTLKQLSTAPSQRASRTSASTRPAATCSARLTAATW